jgi:lactate dehydrogenase-like 2-hydroxyacid dehydrogenase
MNATPVLQVGGLLPALEAELTDEFDRRVYDQAAPLSPEAAAEIRIAVTSGRTGLKADLIDQLPNLELVANFGVGYDGNDTQALAARGIKLTNTPDVLNACVADTALGLLLAAFRQFPEAERFTRAGGWAEGRNYPLTRRFSGSTIGILGMGRIGAEVATRVEGFGCEVLYHNRRPVDGSSAEYVDSLVELARRSDALVITVLGGPSTKHLVNAEVLEALGPDGILVNVARGTVVDEQALIAALESDALGGAGLDVVEDEPNVPAALLDKPNVVVFPHVGSGTHETRADMKNLVLANIRAYLAGEELLTPVALS